MSRKSDSYNELPPTVRFVNEINITGHVIPENWFKWLKYKNGKPQMNAMYILADIIYWHRPSEELDEKTGKVIGYRTKFAGERLQRSRSYYEQKCGFSNQQAKDALDFLADEIGVITKIVEPIITLESGEILSNVPYIDLVPEVLYKITFADPQNTEGGSGLQNRGGVGSIEPRGGRVYRTEGVDSIESRGESIDPTYTENHDNNKKEILDKNSFLGNPDDSPALDPDVAECSAFYGNNIHAITQYVSDAIKAYLKECPKAWLLEAFEIAVENNVHKLCYIQGIMERSVSLGLSPRQAGPPETKSTTRAKGVSPLQIPPAPELSLLPAKKISKVEQVWVDTLAQLQLTTTKATFDSLLKTTQLTKPNGKYVLLTETKAQEEWLNGRLRGAIQHTLDQVVGKQVKLEIHVKGEAA